MSGETTLKSGLKSTVKTLELIKENPLITIPELAIALNKSKSAIEKQIAKLKENQQLERIGPDKGGYWQIKN
ncbi:winged helix-turn-helix transcriptional regulator [Emticicia oligotrophica]|uniref:winged helix-turn-helix transcriptional regulator n=1 Tax=Emticicia oligotrophica TaxID=312279 RepID=UPI00273A9C72|nr:winged helix-turn-helix transcriptional regulator [Emticicia oligotrophica]